VNVRMHGINERLVALSERLEGLESRLSEGPSVARIAAAPGERVPDGDGPAPPVDSRSDSS
jgi:hypothetical protein